MEAKQLIHCATVVVVETDLQRALGTESDIDATIIS
jgi:hypothetical protein